MLHFCTGLVLFCIVPTKTIATSNENCIALPSRAIKSGKCPCAIVGATMIIEKEIKKEAKRFRAITL